MELGKAPRYPKCSFKARSSAKSPDFAYNTYKENMLKILWIRSQETSHSGGTLLPMQVKKCVRNSIGMKSPYFVQQRYP